MFNKATLKSDLESVFSQMKQAGENAKDTDFANGIADACKSFGESGTITTSDGGTLSSGAGVFAGSGTGSLSLTASFMSSPVITACNAMKSMTSGGDIKLAEAIGSGILAMTSQNDVVSTNVTGGTTNPAGSVVPPSSGSAKGTITCDNSDLIQGLKDAFTSMKNHANESGFDGDVFLASEMSDLIESYFKSGEINTEGSGALSGSSGAGSIS